MAIIFNGKKFAAEKEAELVKKILVLKKKGITPRLETIIDGNNPSSVLYTKLKQKAAERIGAEVGIFPLAKQKRDKRTFLISLIKTLNEDPDVHGIMVQLPLSDSVKMYTKQILNVIDPKKDVDGHLEESLYVPATVRAILEIIEESKKEIVFPKKIEDTKIAVIGAAGTVGKPLVKELKNAGYGILAIDKANRGLRSGIGKSHIVISVAGSPGVIKGRMVGDGACVIDAGSPKADVMFSQVVKRASFITPVPGGVGPVTISCLLENLVDAAYNQAN